MTKLKTTRLMTPLEKSKELKHRKAKARKQYLEDFYQTHGQPAQSQLEGHRIDHYPFRSWCPECVAGRATGEQHRAHKGDRAVPVFGSEYFFITKLLEVVRSLSEGDEVLPKTLVATVFTGMLCLRT